MNATTKPNIVFILGDNAGYGDLGCNGGSELRGAPTPRLDQMAREGPRLTQFFVEVACTPSQAALMTGQYSIRSGLLLVCVAGSLNTLHGSAVTMPKLFKDVGYSTAMYGKWHLGRRGSVPKASQNVFWQTRRWQVARRSSTSRWIPTKT